MRIFLVVVSLLLLSCSPAWEESPYEVYYIDGTKTLGHSLGEGAYIGRIDEPVNIEANDKYISVYACPYKTCALRERREYSSIPAVSMISVAK